MKTRVLLRNEDGTELTVLAEDITPLGFQSVIGQQMIPDIRDNSGRFRIFDICILSDSDTEGFVIGQCRVQSVRRVCADKSVISVRYEHTIADAYRRLSAPPVTLYQAPLLRHA